MSLGLETYEFQRQVMFTNIVQDPQLTLLCGKQKNECHKIVTGIWFFQNPLGQMLSGLLIMRVGNVPQKGFNFAHFFTLLNGLWFYCKGIVLFPWPHLKWTVGKMSYLGAAFSTHCMLHKGWILSSPRDF